MGALKAIDFLWQQRLALSIKSISAVMSGFASHRRHRKLPDRGTIILGRAQQEGTDE